MEAVDWPTALANKKRKGLGSFEKRIPTSPIRDQGSYRRGMKRDDTRLAELAFTDRYQSLG
jgi:hypothetical protein